MPLFSLTKKLFSLALPVTVLVLVPLAVESRWRVRVDIEFFVGVLLAAAGLAVLAVTTSMLFRVGKGTIAPWSPTRTLVVSGFYRHVRNPMIVAVLAALLGESLIFHSVPVFEWLIVFFVINNIYFLLSEEPGLAKRFGDEYLEYKRNVPRWVPRFKPWAPKS